MEEIIGILQQRRIEANVISAFHGVLTKELGLKRARSLVSAVIRELAFEKGRELRRLNPEGDLAALAELWQKLSAGGALDIEFLEKSPDCLRLRVHRCGYADAYREMGIAPELGILLSCSRDEPLSRGYSDKITFECSQTILQGAKYCELIYKVKK